MRYINDIIVHCTATPPGMDVDSSLMRAWDKQRGLRTIAYHYLVRLDGTVENGRAVSQPGAHCKMHNAHSVGVCYVGGLDDAGTICDTRTDDQKAALLKLLTTLTRMYRCRIHGHRDYEATLCPGFDVDAEYGNIYRQIVIEGR